MVAPAANARSDDIGGIGNSKSMVPQCRLAVDPMQLLRHRRQLPVAPTLAPSRACFAGAPAPSCKDRVLPCYPPGKQAAAQWHAMRGRNAPVKLHTCVLPHPSPDPLFRPQKRGQGHGQGQTADAIFCGGGTENDANLGCSAASSSLRQNLRDPVNATLAPPPPTHRCESGHAAPHEAALRVEQRGWTAAAQH